MAKGKTSAKRPPETAAPPAEPVQDERVRAEVEEGLRALSSSIGEAAPAAEPVEPESTSTSTSNLLNQDPQLVSDFLVEAREHLANIEGRLLEIEQGSHTRETLNSAFRSFHTIKGLAGFLEYDTIRVVSHEVETLLDLARNEKLVLDPATVDIVLQSGDYLGLWLNTIEGAQQGRNVQTPEPPDALLDRVRAAAVAQPEAAASAAAPPQAPVEAIVTPPAPQAVAPEAPAPAPAAEAPAAPAPEAAATPADAPAAERSEQAPAATSQVKVDTQKLEYLVDMVGELTIAQSMLRHNPALVDVKNPRLQRDVSHLTRVTAEVQKTAMAMRMVPIGQLFRRMSRLVRDLGRKSGKQADLELIGEDVEIDRNIVEELADPLVHMLRNSMDHGMEMPDERVQAGKPPVGRVRLKASHLAGMICIEISDDGRGLDRSRILRKAVERGLASADSSLSDNEIFHLIFEPGFSTAEKVTDVSGRGVGMDVVRKQVTKLRGRIEIESAPGKGTTFYLKLPLTLAIIDGLVVITGGERYIVPIYAVREMFKPTEDKIFTVEGRGEMVMVRERLLPVLRLGNRLGVRHKSENACDGLMIVGESESRTFCLLVDELVGKQEVVIKSLGSTFRDVRGIAGGAILGDGRVGLILDLATLAGDTGASGPR
jgi:two-component system chemotaxis sensor kinase CheA